MWCVPARTEEWAATIIAPQKRTEKNGGRSHVLISCSSTEHNSIISEKTFGRTSGGASPAAISADCPALKDSVLWGQREGGHRICERERGREVQNGDVVERPSGPVVRVRQHVARLRSGIHIDY